MSDRPFKFLAIRFNREKVNSVRLVGSHICISGVRLIQLMICRLSSPGTNFTDIWIKLQFHWKIIYNYYKMSAFMSRATVQKALLITLGKDTGSINLPQYNRFLERVPTEINCYKTLIFWYDWPYNYTIGNESHPYHAVTTKVVW